MTGRLASTACALLLLALLWPAPALANELGAQLEALAEAEGFSLSGLDRLEDEPARPIAEAHLARRLELLLDGYNYILLYDKDDRVAEVRITGLAPATVAGPPRGAIDTRRRNGLHLVDAELVGPNGRRRKLSLVVDTGATTVVLPASMIRPLGFKPEDLRDGWSETAGGRVQIKVARLDSVRVGPMLERDVAVSFIADEKLGELSLLGASFLDRFRLTFDDRADRIILLAK